MWKCANKAQQRQYSFLIIKNESGKKNLENKKQPSEKQPKKKKKKRTFQKATKTNGKPDTNRK